MFDKRGFFAILCVLAACLTGLSGVRAEGMKVNLKGKTEKITATRAAFDGKDFRILTAGGEIRIAGTEVISIEVESAVSGLKTPAAEITQLSAEVKKLEDKNRSLTQEIMQYKTALDNSIGLEDRFQPQLMHFREQVEKLTSELTGEKERAELEKQRMSAELSLKDAKIAALQEAAETKPTPQIPKVSLDIRDQLTSQSPLAGATRVTGLIANRDSIPYETVVLEISLLDAQDKVLGLAHTFVTKVEANDRRPFVADVQTPFVPGLQVKVVPALVTAADGGRWRKEE